MNPSHIDVINHEMYQKMFNENNQHFLALIISPYFSTSYESASNLNALPKLRIFTTVNHAGARIVPYEVHINIIPQRKILHKLLLENILCLYENPYKVDGINLNNESV